MAETIGAAIITAVISEAASVATIGATTITYSAVVGTIALTAASIGLQLAFAQGGNLPKPENGHETIRQAVPVPIYAFGRNRIAGALALAETTTQGHSIDVKGLHDGRICGFTGNFWLNDDPVVLNELGFVQLSYLDERYGGNNIFIDTRDGLDVETAYEQPQALLDPGIWTDNHRGDYTATLYMFCNEVEPEEIQKIYPHGLPDVSAELDCQGCFDPREATHVQADRSTWEADISYNPALELIRFIFQERGGMGFDYDLCIGQNLEQWIEAADNCDEPIDLDAGGTEPRYQCHFVYTAETENNAVIQQFLNSCDGWLSEGPDGSLSFFVGRYKDSYADIVIEAEDIREFTINYGVGDDEAVNELQVSFTWPAAAYKQIDCDPIINTADQASRGARIAQPFFAAAVHSFTQARRLASRKMDSLSADMRGRLVLTLTGTDLWKRRWFKIRAPELHEDFTDIVVEVRGREIDLANASVIVDYIRIDPETIDRAVEEGTPPELPADQTQFAIPRGVILEAHVSGEDADGPHIDLTLEEADVSTAQYALQYRLVDNGDGLPGPWSFRRFPSPTIDTDGVHVTLVPALSGLLEIQSSVFYGSSQGQWSESVFIANELPALDFHIPQNSGQFIRLIW